MYIYLFALFLVVALLSVTEDYIDSRQRRYIVLGMVAVMVMAATFKDVSTVADSEAYERMFYDNDDPLNEIATEPTYIYLSRLILMFGGGIACIFFIYAIISIPLKMWSISRMTPFFFSALVIYVPIYYELHDLVQIRAAVAGAFLLLSIYFYGDRQYKKLALAYVAAVLFHYSSISFLPVFLVGNYMNGKRTRVLLACLVPLGFMLYFTHRDLLSLIPSSLLGAKVDFYRNSAEIGSHWSEMLAPYKNLYFLVKCAVLYVYLYYYDYLKEKSKYFALLCVVEAGSLFWMLSMSTIPVVATRISDLYGIVDAVFLSYALYLIEPKIAARACLIGIGLYMFVYNMLFANYFG